MSVLCEVAAYLPLVFLHWGSGPAYHTISTVPQILWESSEYHEVCSAQCLFSSFFQNEPGRTFATLRAAGNGDFLGFGRPRSPHA